MSSTKRESAMSIGEHRKRLNDFFISTRDEKIHKEYKKIRNKVKSETVRLTQQEQNRISAECKVTQKDFGNISIGKLRQKPV